MGTVSSPTPSVHTIWTGPSTGTQAYTERVKLTPGGKAGAGPAWRVASRAALGPSRSWQGPQVQGASVKTMLVCPLPHWFQRHRVVGLAYRKAGWEGDDRPGSESNGQPRGWASWRDVRGSSRGDTWSHMLAASPAAPRVRCSERSPRPCPCSLSVLRPAEGRRRLRGRKASEKFKQAREQHVASSVGFREVRGDTAVLLTQRFNYPRHPGPRLCGHSVHTAPCREVRPGSLPV